MVLKGLNISGNLCMHNFCSIYVAGFIWHSIPVQSRSIPGNSTGSMIKHPSLIAYYTRWFNVLPSKNGLARNMQFLQVFFLARLARSCTKSCKSCTKNEAFLARYEKSCKNLARKFCKIIFLQDFDHILQQNYFTIFSCKILARFFISCKKSFIFSARLADFVQDLASLARKILARFAYFLQDRFTG